MNMKQLHNDWTTANISAVYKKAKCRNCQTTDL